MQCADCGAAVTRDATLLNAVDETEHATGSAERATNLGVRAVQIVIDKLASRDRAAELTGCRTGR